MKMSATHSELTGLATRWMRHGKLIEIWGVLSDGWTAFPSLGSPRGGQRRLSSHPATPCYPALHQVGQHQSVSSYKGRKPHQLISLSGHRAVLETAHSRYQWVSDERENKMIDCPFLQKSSIPNGKPDCQITDTKTEWMDGLFRWWTSSWELPSQDSRYCMITCDWQVLGPGGGHL